MSNILWPHGLKPARFLCPWDSPGKNAGVGSHSLLPGIFPTQGSNLGLPHFRQILYRNSDHNLSSSSCPAVSKSPRVYGCPPIITVDCIVVKSSKYSDEICCVGYQKTCFANKTITHSNIVNCLHCWNTCISALNISHFDFKCEVNVTSAPLPTKTTFWQETRTRYGRNVGIYQVRNWKQL